jgi:transposase InsO family protein
MHPVELRLKAVKLHLEEGFPLDVVSAEVGVCPATLKIWVERYQAQGRAGLERRSQRHASKPTALSAAVQAEIVRVKQQQPSFGIRRIAQWMRRVLLLPASPETVRKTLHRHKLLPKTKLKRPRNPPKPRFFERATPMQLWQSDICTIRLGGKQAYLIGFMDDHSRYLVGLDLFSSQTSENVLELYRRAVAEYGAPKEMLTDNGRQYATWRGKTRFQMELQQDNIHHIRSQPHHPMTLGKIERFWKTIWDEFLCRAQFATFEEARDRIRLWVKYYNHKRPHQSLEGMCPADRFFVIQQPLRQVIEQGIQDNIQELALRGQPKPPFYMVGRMGEQSLVMKMEAGEFKMVLDGAPHPPVKTVEGQQHEQHGGEASQGTDGPQRPREMPGCAGGVDAAAAAGGNLQGTERAGEPVEQLARTGAGGYAPSLGTADAAGNGAGSAPDAAPGKAVGTETSALGKPDQPAGAEGPGRAGATAGEPLTCTLVTGEPDDEDLAGSVGATDPAGACREPDGHGSGTPVGSLPQNLLPVGSTGVAGLVSGAPAESGGPALVPVGYREATVGTGEPAPATGTGDRPTTAPHPGATGAG